MHFDDVWTPKLVGEVLVDAAMWSIASAGPTGPADDLSQGKRRCRPRAAIVGTLQMHPLPV